MDLRGSPTSCGLYELVGVGGYDRAGFEHCDPTIGSYNAAIKSVTGSNGKYMCAFIMASLTKGQQKGVRFLLERGFVQVSEWKKNPNSGNEIAIFILQMDRDSNQMLIDQCNAL